MNPVEKFNKEKIERIEAFGKDETLKDIAHQWIKESMAKEYVYNFTWLGRPIIQNPIEMFAMQEIIWKIKPDLIIETGIAHGGSIIFYASMLELIGKGEALGIDIDIRPHNSKAIEKHTMFKRITMVQGSSIDPNVIKIVNNLAFDKEKVLVCLDSYHTHEHVLKELELYSPFVTHGSYLVVFDTFVEDMPPNFYPNRPWTKGNNPKTAIHEFLKTHDEFEIDKSIDNKLIITTNPDGYLKRVK